jgi:hypothetical protein
MATTSRALAFASRWFDEQTVHRVFEPLIADWQREWQQALPARRWRVSVRGLCAFVCAVVVSSPRLALTPAPPAVTRHVAVRMLKFVAILTPILMIPVVIEIGTWWMRDASWVRASLILFAVPSAITLAFPFAMAGAVDAIRRRGLPAHVERAAALKLGAFALAFMMAYSGWIVPASSRAAGYSMNPPGMGAPLRGMRDLTTYELVVDPARATVFAPGAHLASQSISRQRELSQRAALVALPLVLLWLRWRALSRPGQRSPTPLAEIAGTTIAIATLFAASYGGARLERDWQMWAGSGSWLPVATFFTWGLMASVIVNARTPPASTCDQEAR